MVCACIDIGSNTTRLLAAEVSEGGLVELAARRSFTRLGAGQGPGGTIPGEKVRENAEVVAEQLAAARDAGATEVSVVATAAIRRAPNREELVDAVKRLTGVPVRVLSGAEEAHLCFRGATRELPRGDESVAVVDVGGASVEVAVGSPGGEVVWWESLPTGSSLLTEAHVRCNPPDEADLEALRRAAANAVEDLAPPPVQEAMAVGGTATSLRLLVGGELGHADLERGVALLARTPAGEVTRQLGLDPERARLLPAGMILLQVVGERLGRSLRLAHGGLREGAVLELAHASDAGLA